MTHTRSRIFWPVPQLHWLVDVTSRSFPKNLYLPLILGISLVLRIYGISWDSGFLFHPDERAILFHVSDLAWPTSSNLLNLFDADLSSWNPAWFPYGSFPLYLLKFVQIIFSPAIQMDLVDLSIAGRTISALADTLSVLVVYLIGTRVYGNRVGLLSAVVMTFAVLHVQLSHFYAVDTLATLFVLLSIHSMIRLTQEGGIRWSVLSAVWVGLALATKISMLPLMAPFILSHALSDPNMRPNSGINGKWSLLRLFDLRRSQLYYLVPSTAAMVGVVFIAQPYMFLDFNNFLGDAVEQSEMVRRIRDLPYTRQYINTTIYFYHMKQLLFFGLGVPLGLVSFTGWIFVTSRAIVKPRVAEILLLSWAISYFLIVGSFEVKFIRYMLPLVPFLLIFGSEMMLSILVWIKRYRSHLTSWAKFAICFVVIATIFYCIAYTNIYRHPHTALRASEWMEEHVPPDSRVLKEHWEEGIPGMSRYRVAELPLYDADEPGKWRSLSEKLSESDYLVFFSSRLYGTIPRLIERYPQASNYYKLLFEGKLGYELVHFERTMPSLLGITIENDTFRRPGISVPGALAVSRGSPFQLNLGFADESFFVYDHPTVLLFENRKRYDPVHLYGLIMNPLPLSETLDSGLMPMRELAIQGHGGTWREIVPSEGVGARHPILIWVLMVYVVSIVSVPLTLRLFIVLADRGYFFARILGLLVATYISWILADLEWMNYSRESLILGTTLLGLVSTWCLWRFWDDIWGFVRTRWKLILTQEVLFLSAFFIFVLIRMANPDLWHPFRGGEKPMDFAYLNAVIKSTIMPPYDPWFSGQSLNYYYYGHYIVGSLIKTSGIPSVVGYNLAVPLLFAFAVGACFSLAYNLAAAVRGFTPLNQRISSFRLYLAGIIGFCFVVVLANLEGSVQLIRRLWSMLVERDGFGAFDFWSASRMMPPDPPGFEITEFPFFSFLFADLHAHLISLPFVLLALCLVINGILLRTGTYGSIHFGVNLLVMSFVVGSLWATNAWDFPTFLALGIASVFLGLYLTINRFRLDKFIWGVLWSLVFVGAAFLIWLPYHLNLNNAYSGLVLNTTRTPFWQYLEIHGLFIVVIVVWLIMEARMTMGNFLVGFLIPTHPIKWLIAAIFISLIGCGFWLGFSTLTILSLLLASTVFVAKKTVLSRSLKAPNLGNQELPTIIGLFLLSAGLMLGILVEIVAIEGDIDRMNTVFKFYFQAWIILGLVAAFGFWKILVTGRLVFSSLSHKSFLAVATVLIIGSLIYPVFGTHARVSDRFSVTQLTLDGSEYMWKAIYNDNKGSVRLKWDREALDWFWDEVDGSPTIVEALTPEYRWGGRISKYTGLPAVIGWEWHQKQQRCGIKVCGQVEQRVTDVNRMYMSTDSYEVMELLNYYGVNYIYVGQTERLYYPVSGIEKFEVMVEIGLLTVQYENPGVIVYGVRAERVT